MFIKNSPSAIGQILIAPPQIHAIGLANVAMYNVIEVQLTKNLNIPKCIVVYINDCLSLFILHAFFFLKTVVSLLFQNHILVVFPLVGVEINNRAAFKLFCCN